MAILNGSQVTKYFNFPQMVQYFLYSLGGAVIFGIFEIWIGAVISALAAVGLIFYGLVNVPSDKDIEDTFNHYANNLESNALESLNITKDDLIRPSDWLFYDGGAINGTELRYREGADDVVRANTMGILYMLYGSDQLMTYHILYNIEEEQESVASNSEFFYKDVVGVSMKDEQEFTLMTSGGQQTYPLVHSNDNENRTEKVMKSVRAMIREKKG